MTLTTRSKRSKLRDFLIIIRLFICCITVLFVNWLRACIQYTLEPFNAESKKPQSIACTKGEDIHRIIYEKFKRRCLQGSNRAKNKKRTHNQHKKWGGSGRRRTTCLHLQPPPVEELIFTRDDVWRTKNNTSKLTQPQLQVYSSDSINYNPDKTHNHRVNGSLISFSREVKQSVPRAKGTYVQAFVSCRNPGWSQQGSHLQPKADCKCRRSSSVCSRFTTLSRVIAGKQVHATVKTRYAQRELMKRDNGLNVQLSSQVETWNECRRTQKLSNDVAPDSVHRCLTASAASYREGNTSDTLMSVKETGFLHSWLFQDVLKVQNQPLNCVNKEAVSETSLLQNAANILRPSPLPALQKATFKSSTYDDHTYFLEYAVGVSLKPPVKNLSRYEICNSRSTVTNATAV